MKYILNLLISIDQLGNVIAGGNPDNTISARVGFYNYHYSEEKKVTLFWKVFEFVIDTTFWPIDGPNHCHEAYHNDAGEFFDTGTKDWAVAVLSVFIIGSCVFIAGLLYTLYVVNLISPKKIDRANNIRERLVILHAKLNATGNEIREYPIPKNEELIMDAQLNIECATDILMLLKNMPENVTQKA